MAFCPFGPLASRGGEGLDAVGAEARKMGVGGDDDGDLQIAQAHHVVAGLGVFGDVDDGVVEDSGTFSVPECGVALHACGFGVDGDVRHFFDLLGNGGFFIGYTANFSGHMGLMP